MHSVKRIIRYICYSGGIVAVCFLIWLLVSPSVTGYLDGMLRQMVDEGAPESRYEPIEVSFMDKTPDRDVSSDGDDKTDEGSKAMEVPETGTLYGRIISDPLGLDVPLYYGDSDEILQLGAGQYANGAVPGMDGTIIIGGHDSTYFNGLKNMTEGGMLEIETDYGRFEYKVAEIVILDADSDMSVIVNSGRAMVLYTCYPYDSLIGQSTQRIFYMCDELGG